jgi:hypothetical protein
MLGMKDDDIKTSSRVDNLGRRRRNNKQAKEGLTVKGQTIG